MLQPDFQKVFNSGLIVVATVAYMVYLLPTLPPDRFIIALIGNTLLLVVLGALVLSTDLARYTEKRGLDLLPQTQLALWLAGMIAIVLATDGLRWFDPGIAAWVFTAAALTLASRLGFIWLWHQLTSRLKRGQE